MVFWLALAAAFGGAVFYGVAAVLEKVSADKQARATSLRVGLLWRLVQDWPYLGGLLLDGLGFLLALYAVHTLPLFVVQPIVACSVVVTVLIDRFMLQRKLGGRTNVAMLCIVLGLVALALTASPEKALGLSNGVRWGIILAPLPLAIAGAVFVKRQQPYVTTVLAALSGVAFGGTAIVGRALHFSQPYWHTVFQPLFWALIAYGLVGMLVFSVALQRHRASVVNATMVVFETLVPIAAGIAFLGDSPKHGSWGYVAAGVVLAFVGTTMIITTPPPLKLSPKSG